MKTVRPIMKILLTALFILTAINTAGVFYLVAQRPEATVATLSNGQVEQGGSSGPFHKQSVGEQISQASVIFTVRYEAKGDLMIGVVHRILKKADGTEFYYNVGDHYAGADFNPNEESRGEGMVNFCLGSPAESWSGVSIYNGRIPSLGGIKLEALETMVENTK